MCPSTIDIDMVCYLKYNFFQCPKNLGCERKLSLFSPEFFFSNVHITLLDMNMCTHFTG